MGRVRKGFLVKVGKSSAEQGRIEFDLNRVEFLNLSSKMGRM